MAQELPLTQIVNPTVIMSPDEIRGENVGCLRSLPMTSFETMEWLAKRGLIANSVRCIACNIQMTCCKRAQVVNDGYMWKCRHCGKSCSIRSGSFFSGSNLALEKLLVIIYCWAFEYPQWMVAREAQLGMGEHTVLNWFNFCREVCEEYFIQNEIVIGGLNPDGTSKTVEIDESKFFQRKYHRGQWLPGHWVFGGIERETRRCFLVEVPDRTEPTLSALIERHILPGSIIVSNGWAAYRNIGNIGGGFYEHRVIVHEEHYVDSDDRSIHTQNVENMWMRAKRKLRRQFGTSEALFHSYLHEFAWRNQYPRDNALGEFLVAVGQQYPLR